MHGNGTDGHLWRDALVDSILAGLAALLAVLVTQPVPDARIVYAAFLAFAVALVMSLIAARKRGHGEG